MVGLLISKLPRHTGSARRALSASLTLEQPSNGRDKHPVESVVEE